MAISAGTALLTNLDPAEADATQVLHLFKGQEAVERRYQASAWHYSFSVSSNARCVKPSHPTTTLAISILVDPPDPPDD
jgi:hypothetical protein